MKPIAATGLVLVALLSTGCAPLPSTTSAAAAASPESLLADMPYALNFEALSALDPRPLRISSFAPDTDERAKGIRIVSTGRIFPYVYEVISIANVSDEKIVDSVSSSLDGKPGIILKKLASNDRLGRHIHYFQQYDKNGSPHHVSSNYIFLKNGTFYHLSAANYANSIPGFGSSSWGSDQPDPNAEAEVMNLLSAMEFK